MHIMWFYTFTALVAFVSRVTAAPYQNGSCRNLPGDRDWPSDAEWNSLNRTVHGRLIRGVPIGRVCYGPDVNATACSEIQSSWGLVNHFLDQPVSVISPYWENNSCDPFLNSAANDPSLCQLGHMASYAINISDAATAAAGIQFARDKNLRLIIKNTGHDYLGGSVGKGSLALWTHHLKDIKFVDKYKTAHYTGAAVQIGAGVQFGDLYKASSDRGLRVVGGSCPSVGAAGGWRQAGGHGPLASSYGLGADNALEYQVVTVDGKCLTASPTENRDLFWAISGGGAGNYAVVISVTIKAYKDGPVAGSTLTFPNTNNDVYWAAVEAWMRHLLVLDRIPGFASETLLTQSSFSIVGATLPGGDVDRMTQALGPFYENLAKLNITPTVNETAVQSNYLEHYLKYIAGDIQYPRNITIGSRLIPRSLVQNSRRLEKLTARFRDIISSGDTVIYLLGYNVTAERAGIRPGSNAVTSAWRDSLFLTNVVTLEPDRASWATMSGNMARMNTWQDQLRELTPGGGAYLNEGTYNTPQWKADYFGGTYDRLRAIKARYDPQSVLYARPGVGSDEYVERPDGHLCKV